MDVLAARRADVVERDLVRHRAVGGAIEEREPERPSRLGTRTLVDGVADPHAARARGVESAQVEALVVPLALCDVWKARLGPQLGHDPLPDPTA